MKTLQGLPLTVLILGGWLTVNLGRICKDFARITSDSVDPGGSIDSQLRKDLWRLCKDYLWQCWSWGSWLTVINLGRIGKHFAMGVSIDSQLRKDPWRFCKDYLWQYWSWGQSTVNVGRIHKDFARITSDSVDPGGQSTVNLGRICKDFARITSDSVDPGGSIDSQLRKDPKTLQGLPLTVMILGKGVNWQ